MRNLRLDICYDGTRYQGWQRLKDNDNTIQGKIEDALSRILEEEIKISGSGRTDAGAHAIGQVANFHCESEMSCQNILQNLRKYLPGDIGIYSCRDASERFHARLNAKRKTYCYRIWNSEKPCVFDRRFVHVVDAKLDIDRMQQAAEYFCGQHDFAAFCTNSKSKKSTIREINSLMVEATGDEIRISVTGDGFLYNMVRIIAGTLVEVGLDLKNPDSIPELFGGRREQCGPTLPAKGLCLMEVEY
jgi:tRNA pseudouridine38-40 synthase